MSKRIVVTGMGVVSSVGIGWEEFQKALFAGERRFGKVERFQAEDGTDVFGAEVPDAMFLPYVDKADIRRLDRFGKMNMAGVQVGIQDAGFTREEVAAGRLETVGLILNTTFGSWESTNVFAQQLIDTQPTECSPRVFPNTVLNAAQGQVAIKFRLKGPTSTLTGIPAIAYGIDLIRSGRAEQLIVGGVDEMHANVCKSYEQAGMAAPFTAESFVGRPGESDSPGFTMGEGMGVLFIETEEQAAARGARVYAEVLSYGIACDPEMSQDMTKADPSGDSFAYAMEQAIREAGLKPSDVDAVVAASNGVRPLDQAEKNALDRVFGTDRKLPVAYLKALVGETFGASTSLAAVAGVLMLRAQEVPGSGAHALRHVLVNGVEIGGNQVSVLLKVVS
jgi:3-oxoacyl-[acyl-carrier-protein] synthase II